MSVVSPRDFAAVARPKNVGFKATTLSTYPPLIGRLLQRRKFGPVPVKGIDAAKRQDIAQDAVQGITQDIVQDIASDRTDVRSFALVQSADESAPSPIGGAWKRAIDVAIATTGTVLVLPAFLVIALAVKLSMGGPVFYRHRRIGFAGRPFDCLKFRTMVQNGEEVLKQHLAQNPEAAEEWRRNRKLLKDPRVTHLGLLLRKSSLDELPQLLNILRGEMSCVGPRPIVPEELERYGAHAAEYLRARPGITGSWQVSGRSNVGYGDRVKLDADYVRRWSLKSDFLILLRTFPALFKVDQTA